MLEIQIQKHKYSGEGELQVHKIFLLQKMPEIQIRIQWGRGASCAKTISDVNHCSSFKTFKFQFLPEKSTQKRSWKIDVLDYEHMVFMYII